MRFRVSVNVSEGLRGQLGDLASSLINDLRVLIRGWDASRRDFKNGFILGSEKYYYIVKVDSSILDAVTNNPWWVANTLKAVIHTVKSSKLPVEIGVGFKEEHGVINVEVVLTPRQEGKN